MPVSVRCTSCGASYNLSSSLEGKKVRCKECQEIFLARAEASSKEMLDALPVDDDEPEEVKPSRSSRSLSRTPGRSNARAALDRFSRDRDDDDAWDDERSARPRKKEGGNGLFIGILVGGLLLLLIGLGVGGYLIYRISSNVEETVDNVTEQLDIPPDVWVAGQQVPNFRGGNPTTVDEALAALRSPMPGAPEAGARWLIQNPIPAGRKVEVGQALVGMLGARPDSVADRCRDALEKVVTPELTPAIVAVASNPSNHGWLRAAELLAKLKNPQAAEVLAGHLNHWGERGRVTSALRAMGPGAQNAVLRYLFHPDDGVRAAAEELLNGYGTPEQARIDQALKDLAEGAPREKQVVLAWLGSREGDEALRARVATALTPLLSDENHDVRTNAASAAVKWGSGENVPALVELVSSKKFTPWDNQQKKLAMQALGRLKDERGAVPIAAQLNNAFFWADARKALEEMGPIAEAGVLAILNHPDDNYQRHARELLALYKTEDGKIFEQAIKDLADEDGGRRQKAALSLSRVAVIEEKRKEVADAAIPMLSDPKYSVRLAGLTVMEKWATKDCVPAICKVLDDDGGGFEGQKAREQALKILADLKDPQAAPAIGRHLRHFFQREATRKALIALGEPAETVAVELLSTSQDRRIQSEAFLVLKEVGTQKSVPFLQAALKQATAARNRTLIISVQEVLTAIASRQGAAPPAP